MHEPAMPGAQTKITVVIPCFNAAPYLAQTVGSVLEQTLGAHQIVIVDDGSTDASLDIARRFEAACGGLVQVWSKRSGSATRTRNLGASRACGDALMFLDADDVLAPDVLGSLARILAGAPGAVAACPWQRLERIDGDWVARPPSCGRRAPGEDALSAWMSGWYYPPCAVLWSKEAFVATGGWDETAALNDDGDLMMRALASGRALLETSSGTAYYRRLPTGELSLSGKRRTYGGLAGRIAVFEKIAGLLEESGRVDAYRPSLSTAFAAIARDAAGLYDGLGQRAREHSRRYAPAAWQRAADVARRGRRRHGTLPEPPRPLDPRAVIRCGLERAADALATAPSAPLPAPRSGRVPHTPGVSVIIPVYNRAHLLARTLASVLDQTFEDFEVLVIDDCSDDDPAAVVEHCADPRLRYVRQAENRGVAAARNRGLREARAPLVAFLDDDDEWLPQKLALQVALLQASCADVGLIYTGVETVSGGDERSEQIPSARGDLYRELLVRNILHGGGSNVLLRRNVITQIGFFDEHLPAIEDYDYWLRVCRHYRVECVSRPLVRYHDLREGAQGPEGERRRSLNIRANLEARARLYDKHGAQMRAAGLAHLFLLDSARRHLAPGRHDVRGARRLALRAFVLAPTAWEVREMLLRLFLPPRARRWLGSGRRAARRLLDAVVEK